MDRGAGQKHPNEGNPGPEHPEQEAMDTIPRSPSPSDIHPAHAGQARSGATVLDQYPSRIPSRGNARGPRLPDCACVMNEIREGHRLNFLCSTQPSTDRVIFSEPSWYAGRAFAVARLAAHGTRRPGNSTLPRTSAGQFGAVFPTSQFLEKFSAMLERCELGLPGMDLDVGPTTDNGKSCPLPMGPAFAGLA